MVPEAGASEASITWGRLAFRWVSSLAITYVFIALVMTAAAQQRVTAVLDKREDHLSYSSALAGVKSVEEDTRKLNDLRTTEAKLATATADLNGRIAEADEALDGAWSTFAPIMARAARVPECGLNEPIPTDVTQRLNIWNAVLDCARSGALSPKLAGQIADAADSDLNYAKVYAQDQTLRRQVVPLSAQSAKASADRASAETRVEAARSLSSTFDEMNVLRGKWFAFGSLFVEFPPSMLQILLAFVSGTFGALLVTLVLVVYPKSELAAAAGQEYGSRLLLGGLISVGVYVILSGGSAVLGNTDPFAQSQANFMTFCAVGVLAGMFSDRVAAWLSERANAFFSSKPKDASSSDSGSSEPPAPPVAAIR